MSKRDESVLIRPAVLADLPRLVDIFNHYILNSHATFGTEPFTVESRKPWFDSYGQDRHRLLVAESEDGILGYTTSSPYQSRPAFDFTVETSVYLHPGKRLAGIGSKLYTALFEALTTQPVHLALAAIANPNPASIALHRKFGFEEVGTFKEYARKNGVWISSTWFQKPMEGA
jgi:phosphinothricin acetyltransferase